MLLALHNDAHGVAGLSHCYHESASVKMEGDRCAFVINCQHLCSSTSNSVGTVIVVVVNMPTVVYHKAIQKF